MNLDRFLPPAMMTMKTLSLSVILLAVATVAIADDDVLTEARALRLRGRYGEAEAAYRGAMSEQLEGASLGLARTLVEQGRDDEAVKVLTAAIEQAPTAALHAAVAEIEFRRGRREAAGDHVRQAFALDGDNVLARWLAAELLTSSGRLDEANEAYHWLVDFYNDHEIDDVDQLRRIAVGAATYARWNRLTDQFRFLVNELYPELIRRDEHFWPAHYEAGRLFLEKFNPADATKELQAALAINPQAAEVHAALAELALQQYNLDEAQRGAERALEINPRLAAAHRVLADLEMVNFRLNGALERLEEARKCNPLAEETLGRIAAALICRDGWPQDETSDGRLARLMTRIEEQNPHAGRFYLTAGIRLEERRKFDAAARMFELALERMPQLVGVRAAWGMMAMRLGQEDQARELLNESFEIDPFNVRVSNTLKVLEVLEGYETIETEHFLVRHDAQEAILARHAAEHLERVYPKLCAWLGHEPREKSLFEIFSRARNTGAHGWFSARMVGLPYVGTVGACAGKMVALASPNELEEKFNWARVLEHEFVHVINLEQTHNNIPHWFTEALAVWNEGYPRPPDWDRVLFERYRNETLFDLDSINFGFIRPQSSDDWTLAYCQAELYAEYIIERFGEQAISRMLDAYAENLATPATLRRALGVEQDDFEKGYREYIERIVDELEEGQSSAPVDFAELIRQQQSEPEDPDLAAQLADAFLARKQYPEARRMAQQALKNRAHDPLANYVLARLALVTGEGQRAMKHLNDADEHADTQPDTPVVRQGRLRLWGLLGALEYKAQRYDEAADYYRRALEQDPRNLKWTRLLARVYLKQGATARLREVLEQLAAADADDLLVRKKLAQMALAEGNYDQASHWAMESLYCDVLDAGAHRMLGQARVELGQPLEAAAAFENAVTLAPDEPGLRMSLADAYLQADKTEKAREMLEALVKEHPDYPGADVLLESIEP